MKKVTVGIILSILIITSPSGTSANEGELTVPEGAEVVIEYEGTVVSWIWSVDTDSAGNIYVVCFPAENADMDPGPGEDIVSGDGNLLIKFDPEGNYLFSYPDRDIMDFDVDEECNVYVVGETVLSRRLGVPTGLSTAFFRKFDPEGRVMLEINWDRTVGYDDNASYVAVSDEGEIYIAGNYFGTADFDPGDGEFMSTAEGQDIYLLKLNPIGEFQWAKTWGDREIDWTFADLESALEIGPSGEVYLLGKMSGGEENQDSYVYLSCFDGDGTLVWTKQWGDWLTIADKLAVDNSGNIYVAGSFSTIVDLNPGEGESIRDGSVGLHYYLSKFDSYGNFIRVAEWQTEGWLSLNDIAIDEGGNIYAVGYFNGTVDLDPGEGVDTYIAIPLYDCAYVLSLSPEMKYRNALVEPLEMVTYGRSICIASDGSPYLGYVSMALRSSYENTMCRILKLSTADFGTSEIHIEN